MLELYPEAPSLNFIPEAAIISIRKALGQNTPLDNFESIPQLLPSRKITLFRGVYANDFSMENGVVMLREKDRKASWTHDHMTAAKFASDKNGLVLSIEVSPQQILFDTTPIILHGDIHRVLYNNTEYEVRLNSKAPTTAHVYSYVQNGVVSGPKPHSERQAATTTAEWSGRLTGPRPN